MPENSITSRQPMVLTPRVISGRMAAPPEENPVMQMDIASERRRMNHRLTALINTCPSPELLPTPTTPTNMTMKST